MKTTTKEENKAWWEKSLRRDLNIEVRFNEPGYGRKDRGYSTTYCETITVRDIDGYTALELRDQNEAVVRVINARYVTEIRLNPSRKSPI